MARINAEARNDDAFRRSKDPRLALVEYRPFDMSFVVRMPRSQGLLGDRTLMDAETGEAAKFFEGEFSNEIELAQRMDRVSEVFRSL